MKQHQAKKKKRFAASIILLLASTALVTAASTVHDDANILRNTISKRDGADSNSIFIDNGTFDRLRKRTYTKRASRKLSYVTVNGDGLTIEDPVSGECFLLVSGAVHVENGTDKVATVYSDHGCEDVLLTELAPSASRAFGSQYHIVLNSPSTLIPKHK